MLSKLENDVLVSIAYYNSIYILYTSGSCLNQLASCGGKVQFNLFELCFAEKKRNGCNSIHAPGFND